MLGQGGQLAAHQLRFSTGISKGQGDWGFYGCPGFLSKPQSCSLGRASLFWLLKLPRDTKGLAKVLSKLFY